MKIRASKDKNGNLNSLYRGQYNYLKMLIALCILKDFQYHRIHVIHAWQMLLIIAGLLHSPQKRDDLNRAFKPNRATYKLIHVLHIFKIMFGGNWCREIEPKREERSLARKRTRE